LRALRSVGAVIVGLIVAVAFVQGAEAIVHAMNPFPPGMNQRDFNEIKKFVSTLPLSALLLVMTGWLLATVVGTFVAAKIAGSRPAGYITGGILLCAGIANAIIIPQPPWFSAASFVVYVGGTVVGTRWGAS